MISDVYLDHSTYAEPPSRLVAICMRVFYFSPNLDDYILHNLLVSVRGEA